MRKIIPLTAALLLSACDTSKPALETALAHQQELSAQKDSLVNDMLATTQFVNDLNTEMSKVRALNASRPVSVAGAETEGARSPAEARTLVLAQVRVVSARLNESESRLAATRRRIAELARQDSTLRQQVAAYDSTITAYRLVMDNQKAELAGITMQLTALTTENGDLKSTNVQLTSDKKVLIDERDALTTERNTVFYAVGTKEDLLRRHVIVQTGGLLGLGKVQVPARELNPAEFTSIDRTRVSEIPFANTAAHYRIISMQDVSALETVPDANRILTGAIRIHDIEAFWAPSKYLIVVQQ